MNQALYDLVQRAPPQGAGMSMRPEFYSGRGVGTRDVDANRIAIIYNGLGASAFPPTAQEHFIQLVLALPRLTGSDFIESLIRFAQGGYVYAPEQVSDDLLHIGPDDGSREAAAISGIFSLLARPEDESTAEMLTEGMKMEFMHRIGKEYSGKKPSRHMTTPACDYYYRRD